MATRREFLNALKRELLAEQEGEYDADTRWALAWFEQYGVGEGVFGDAETLSKSLGQLGDKRAKRPLRRQLKVEQEASVKRALKDALHQIDPKAKERPPLAAKMSLLGQRLP